jgi:hypothetical protein
VLRVADTEGRCGEEVDKEGARDNGGMVDGAADDVLGMVDDVTAEVDDEVEDTVEEAVAPCTNLSSKSFL